MNGYKPRTIWASASVHFHGATELEIDHEQQMGEGDPWKVSIRFKNSAGEGGQVVIFLDEGCRLQWPLKAMKRKKIKGLLTFVPGKIRYLWKKKEEK